MYFGVNAERCANRKSTHDVKMHIDANYVTVTVWPLFQRESVVYLVRGTELGASKAVGSCTNRSAQRLPNASEFKVLLNAPICCRLAGIPMSSYGS